MLRLVSEIEDFDVELHPNNNKCTYHQITEMMISYLEKQLELKVPIRSNEATYEEVYNEIYIGISDNFPNLIGKSDKNCDKIYIDNVLDEVGEIYERCALIVCVAVEHTKLVNLRKFIKYVLTYYYLE